MCGRRGSGPIGCSEFYAPELRTRNEKLNADAGSLVRGLADIYDTAFLLFVGNGVDEGNVGAYVNGFSEVDQAAVSIDHDGLAVVAELAAHLIDSFGPHRYTHEYSRTAALLGAIGFHDSPTTIL